MLKKKLGEWLSKNKGTLIMFGCFYFVTLAITGYPSLSNTISSDQLNEYNLYNEILKTGAWTSSNHGAYGYVGTTFLSTILPAHIQRVTNLDNPELIFRLFPQLLFALMPGFAWLIARRYLDAVPAVLAGLFVVTDWWIIQNPFQGRVIIGWAFLAMLLYAVLVRRFILSLISSVGIVLAHYGATLFGLVFVGALFAFSWRHGVDWRLGTTFLILLALSYLWFIEITGFRFPDLLNATYIKPDVVVDVLLTPAPVSPAPVSPAPAWRLLESVVILARLGAWAVFFAIGLGILRSWESTPAELRMLAVLSYLTIVAALIVSPISNIYGLSRVYFSVLPVLAIFFVRGVYSAVEGVKISPLWIIIPILVLHSALSPF